MRLLRWIWIGLLIVAVFRPDAALRRLLADRHRTARPDAPNILIIVGDDHAGDTLGIEGDPRQATPRLDALARQGVWFDHAYCNAPLCTPSRQSFITGRLPHAVGVTQLMTRLPDDAVTLGDWLSGEGYDTAAFGKMHFNGPSNHGFAHRLDTADWRRYLKSHPPEGGDQRRDWRPFQDPAAVWLNAACQSDGLPESAMQSTYYADRAGEFFKSHTSEPFALVVGLYEPHAPFRFPREWQGRFRPDQFPPAHVSEADRLEQPVVFAPLTPNEVQGIQAAYYTSISYADHVVGRILDALDASGLAQKTIVVYLGDNGYMRGEHGRFEKHCFYESSVRVPLIVRWPGHLPENRRVIDLVELVDVLPTLMELSGLPTPPNVHGHSLVPLLKGDAGSKEQGQGQGRGRGRDVVFSEYLENEEAMVRSARYKLIVGNGRRRRQDGYDHGHPLQGSYQRLYDLEADPGETTDVSRRPELASTLEELRQQLYDRLVHTREGREPVPAELSQSEAIQWCLVPRD
jgi:choline-sulfatase